MNYEDLMLHAITNAESFKYTAKPNPVVGAILCNENEVISAGHNLTFNNLDATAHAEILAIRSACHNLKTQNLSNCTIFVTLESQNNEASSKPLQKHSPQGEFNHQPVTRK